jgi:ribonuclease-3
MERNLSTTLGVVFFNPRLLTIALTHSSYKKASPEQGEDLPSNERLEFLGDAVLTFLATAWLYERFPTENEGTLSTLRAGLVKRPTLARFARELNLGSHARLGRSEEARAGRERDALLADMFEAILGAIYLDQGIEPARAFVLPFFIAEIERILAGDADIDYRTRLQQSLQVSQGITPTYRTVSESGPPHRRHFTVEVWDRDQCLGSGSGTSKQAASQEAARAALETLEILENERQ